MCTKLLMILIILFALSTSGCVQQENEIILPQAQSLGQEFSTFQPPEKPMETAEIHEIVEPAGTITLRKALALLMMYLKS